MLHNYSPDELKQTGVYAIVRGDEIYIGSTQKSFHRRLNSHRAALKAQRHGNPRLQRIYNKHGMEVFEFKIVEVCTGDPIPTEQKWIDHHRSIDPDKVLNAQIEAGFSCAGMKRSDEWKVKMSLTMTGRKASDDAKASMSTAAQQSHRLAQLRAVSDDPVLKAKRYAAIAKANAGKIPSKETLFKRSISCSKPKITKEQKEQIMSMLMEGKRQKDIAPLFGLSKARISLLAKELHHA